MIADVVLFSLRLRFSDVAKLEKSGRRARTPKLVMTCSVAYDPGATVAGVGAPVPNADTRFDRVVIVILSANTGDIHRNAK